MIYMCMYVYLSFNEPMLGYELVCGMLLCCVRHLLAVSSHLLAWVQLRVVTETLARL